MVFDSDQFARPVMQGGRGLGRFRQSTALIGATLLFCITAGSADAEVLYYAYGDLSGGGVLQPESGGVWDHDESNLVWTDVEYADWDDTTPDANDLTHFDEPNFSGNNADSAVFNSASSDRIIVTVGSNVQAEDITVASGQFELTADPGVILEAENLIIQSGAHAFLQVEADISQNITSEGSLTIRSGREVTAEELNATGSILMIAGTVNADISSGVSTTATIRAGSVINGSFTVNGTQPGGAGIVMGQVETLNVSAGANVAIRRESPVNAIPSIVDDINNSGELYIETDANHGTIASDTITNNSGGVIVARNGDHTLNSAGRVDNLDGATIGYADPADPNFATLTIAADQIALAEGSQVLNGVILQGDITNESVLDMQSVPVLVGSLTNTGAGVLDIRTDVDGNGQTLEHEGTSLTVYNGASITGLGRFESVGNGVLIQANASLEADEIVLTSAGDFTSRGTIRGHVSSAVEAELQGTLIGSYTQSFQATTITGDLDMTSEIVDADRDGIYTLFDGRLYVEEGVTLSVVRLVNNSWVTLGEDGVAATIDGDVVNYSLLQGAGVITGDLTLAGDRGDGVASGSLNVQGSLINDLTGQRTESELSGLVTSYSSLSNLGELELDRATTVPIINLAGGELSTAADATIGGGLTSAGETQLSANVENGLNITGGTTTVVGNISVANPSDPAVEVLSGGTLHLTSGNLSTTSTIVANGSLQSDANRVLNASHIVIAGNGVDRSRLAGTVNSTIRVEDTGEARLGAVTVAGLLTNSGMVTNNPIDTGPAILQGGFVNLGQATLGNAAGRAQIWGTLQNRENATATIVGDVVASADEPGNVINNGTLTLNGAVANSVWNNATGTATLYGSVGANVFNQNIVNLAGRVDGAFNNELGGSALNTVGTTASVSTLSNNGIVNIDQDEQLTIRGASVTNHAGGRMNVNGELTLAMADTSLVNESGAVLQMASSDALINGSIDNSGVANLTGNVSGDVVNNENGSVNMTGTLQVDGSVQNGGRLNVIGTATVSGGVFNSSEDMTVSGSLIGSLTNELEGVANITSTGMVQGTVVNAEGGELVLAGMIDGTAQNYGTFLIDGEGHVAGDMLNYGDLTQTGSGGRLIVDGALENYGTIDNQGSGTFTIYASSYTNAGEFDSGSGVEIFGDFANAGIRRITEDEVLNGDVYNETDAFLYVAANANGQDIYSVYNSGNLEVTAGGNLTNFDEITNDAEMTVRNDGAVRANLVHNEAGGNLINAGTIAAEVQNDAGATLQSTGIIFGDLTTNGTATLSGRVAGDLNVESLGVLTTTAPLTVAGNVNNDGTTTVSAGRLTAASVFNTESFTVLEGSSLSAATIDNARNATIDSDGTLIGTVENAGTLNSSNRINGGLNNTGFANLAGDISGALVSSGTGARVNLTGDLGVGSIENRGGTLTVGNANVLNVDSTLTNTGDGVLRIVGVANVGGGLVNNSTSDGAGLVLHSASTLRGDVTNQTRAEIQGTVEGHVTNYGVMGAAGTISGDLINESAILNTSNDLLVSGRIINRVGPQTSAAATSGVAAGPNDPAFLTVNAGTRATAENGVLNGEGATFTVNGTLDTQDVGFENTGAFVLNNVLVGGLNTTGSAALNGTVRGDVNYLDGALSYTDGATITGQLDLAQNFTVEEGATLNVGSALNRAGTRLNLDGALNGALTNDGTLVASAGGSVGSTDNAGTIIANSGMLVAGSLANDGTVDMNDGAADDVLTVQGGLSGTGSYLLDIDLRRETNGGASDIISVEGGPMTGHVILTFSALTDETPNDASNRVLVFDVDESYGSANDYTYEATGLPSASERIVYTLTQDSDTGQLYAATALNQGVGALVGTVTLTQSLIGSVVNRPSSPFVQGLASDSAEQPCGTGSWARVIGGRATADGLTASAESAVYSSIDASYRGIQFGSDMACFDGRYKGWDLAVGAIGGVNDGSTTQPVYIPDAGDSTVMTNRLGSITSGKFRQTYGGFYLTATRDRMSADLQVRRENTAFELKNRSVGDTQGLGLKNSEFDSNATTISGSLSYSYQLPKEGWMFVPTAGFAFSNTSTDTIVFDDKSTLEIDDSQTRVGFVGGTLSKTFISNTKPAAYHVFGTATVYKDFADDTTSTFTMFDQTDNSVIRSDKLSSSNLGVYGELSLGVNYLRVLETGRAGAPRQFNASIRLDGRTGDVLDSYGITAQMRLQF